VRHDYAKFEIADPPVILSLNVGGEPGQVSHLGIRYPGTGDVASELARAKREGIELLEQKGTTCCYAKADKFWVRDVDGMPWEMYTLLEDAEAETRRTAAAAVLDQQTQPRRLLLSVSSDRAAGLVHRVHQRRARGPAACPAAPRAPG
jgi:hypothetical protein